MGLAGTRYRKPEGLTEARHSTTARDLATLAGRLMADFPEYMHYYALRKYHYAWHPAANDTNRNLLLFKTPVSMAKPAIPMPLVIAWLPRPGVPGPCGAVAATNPYRPSPVVGGAGCKQ